MDLTLVMLRFDTRAPKARRPGHRSVPGPADPLLALQTTAGNAATAGLISVQRKAPELGFFQKVQHSGFAGEAAAIWRTDKDKTIKEYTEALLAKVNDRLVANKVPRIPAAYPAASPVRAVASPEARGRSTSTRQRSRPSR